MSNARAEAAARIGGRWDVRVLEPSPPAAADDPYQADDPLAGGEVVPVDREGTRSWAQLCEEERDPSLTEWCAQRWLVRRRLEPLPAGFSTTRDALHAVAEHVLAPARWRATGKIGLRYTFRGFGTPFFADDRQLRVEDDHLVDHTGRRHRLSTLGAARDFAGLGPGDRPDVYEPTTSGDEAAALAVEAGAARALGDWFGYCASLLEQLRAEAAGDDAPGRVQLWPEHFDLAVDLGRPGERANYGGSPGDDGHDEPYLYVGPWDPRSGDEWNEPFGASLSYRDLLAGADGLAFLRWGRSMLAASPGGDAGEH